MSNPVEVEPTFCPLIRDTCKGADCKCFSEYDEDGDKLWTKCIVIEGVAAVHRIARFLADEGLLFGEDGSLGLSVVTQVPEEKRKR